MAQYGSYKIGGPARYFFHAENKEDIVRALKKWNRKNKIFILGSGTNILFDDNGFDGLVLKPDLKNISVKKNVIAAGAGVLMEDLLNFCVKNELSGLEWAGGLPGTLGGAIRGNAGAFGGEIKDFVLSVSSIKPSDLKLVERNYSRCGFGYRSSIFKNQKNKEIILSAELNLKTGDKAAIKKAIEEKIQYRRERHPLEHFNIGSIFKNVPFDSISKKRHSLFLKTVKNDPFPVVPAAFLLSEAGLKGVAAGGAMISPKHPNFIVNVLSANSADVENLVSLAKEKVKKQFQINLEEEIIRLQ